MNTYLRIHPEDNAWVALQDLAAGMLVDCGGQAVALLQDVPAKHKFTGRAIPEGGAVKMYGTTIGHAATALATGQRLTTENLRHGTETYGPWQGPPRWEAPGVSHWADRTFAGYHRSDGQVGTANYWLVIPLVFCENHSVELLRESLLEGLGYRSATPLSGLQQLIAAYQSGAGIEELLAQEVELGQAPEVQRRLFPNVDGIKFLTHQGGCGGTRQDALLLCQLFAGYLHHPNVAGATVLSLGCQNAQAALLRQVLAERYPHFDKPLYILEHQQIGRHTDFLAQALKHTFAGLVQANACERQPAPLSKLCLGLECGGSDGFSGISANPVLGYATDLLVALGGRAILAEFPELNGVEQALIQRCQRQADAERFVELMQAYSQKAEAAGASFADNPSPGNIKDGLITDAMKSAGAALKGGTSPVVAVLDYAEPATAAGLSLLCTPGNDVESTTGLAASGANLIAFTTGLGTPTGNPVAPVIKISSNTALSERMPDSIDFDTGSVIAGRASIAELGDALLELLIAVASGRPTCAMRRGQDDFIPWKRDLSL
jgi:altronate hydrolase